MNKDIKQLDFTMHGGGGCSGITNVFVHKISEASYEARVGFALMGNCNMTEDELNACDRNPFHENYNDNYCVGKGITQHEALDNLQKELVSTGDSLWI